MRAVYLAISTLLFGILGCGGAQSDTPAQLTPEQEQEILDQVENAAQDEEGKQD